MALLNAWQPILRVCFSLLLGNFLTGVSGAQEIEEYQMKAAYLYNFLKFVEWPAPSFVTSTSPIVICVLGENPFGGTLQEAVRGNTASDRAVVVRPIADLAGARSCHVLFIGAATWKRDRPPLGALAGSALLTVGESPGFAASGGIIRLKLDGARLRFEINVEAARQARLRISSKLLSLADIVKARE